MDSAPYQQTRGHHHGLNPSGRGESMSPPGVRAQAAAGSDVGYPSRYTLRLMRRIPAQPGYSQEGEGVPTRRTWPDPPGAAQCAPSPRGTYQREALGSFGCRVAYHDRGSRSVGLRGDGTVTAGEPGFGAGSWAARPAFPGREFLSHLTVPLRRLSELTTLHSTLCVGECAAAPGT